MSTERPRLLVATFNPGKARELVRLLSPAGFEVVGLSDLGVREPYEETGGTYEDNARGKALHYAALARLTALADDSGLEVDALGGRPGPLSARYGGGGPRGAGRGPAFFSEVAGGPPGGGAARPPPPGGPAPPRGARAPLVPAPPAERPPAPPPR